jgi:hypothetical protein
MLRCGIPNTVWDYDTGQNLLPPGEIRENLAKGDGGCAECAQVAVTRMVDGCEPVPPVVAESAIWDMIDQTTQEPDNMLELTGTLSEEKSLTRV